MSSVSGTPQGLKGPRWACWTKPEAGTRRDKDGGTCFDMILNHVARQSTARHGQNSHSHVGLEYLLLLYRS